RRRHSHRAHHCRGAVGEGAPDRMAEYRRPRLFRRSVPDGLAPARIRRGPYWDGFTIANRRRILNLAAARRLPAMYESRDWATEGGRMAYGADDLDLYRRAGTYWGQAFTWTTPAGPLRAHTTAVALSV